MSRWADVAVLTRRNADIAPLYAELTARDVPVEIVGLGGLLHLPEIMDITATLRLIEDVTANPDLIRLLTGPRWQVGPRDLALLGRRARELARAARVPADEPGEEPGSTAVLTSLEQAVAEVDPTEVVSLLDALDSPGEAAYSPEARERFARLSAELGMAAAALDEPVLDLTRRVITTIGLDVELMATPEFARTSRRDQLGAFLDAVAGLRRRRWRCLVGRACSGTCRLRASRARGWSRLFPPTVRRSSCSLCTRPRVWSGRPSFYRR